MELGVTAVARRLGLSTARVVQLNREGKLPAVRDDANRRRFDSATVEAFARQRASRHSTAAAADGLESATPAA